jgi:hypothetical protein
MLVKKNAKTKTKMKRRRLQIRQSGSFHDELSSDEVGKNMLKHRDANDGEAER